MIATLCGSKNVEKILIFLFVNGKCYGAQMHRLLGSPLTPLQKGLFRLEKEGVLMSYYEGKTRLYQFNPTFPLLHELEQLIRKAYTLLSPQEKKLYFCREEAISRTGEKNITFSFWQRLATVRELSFAAKSRSQEVGGWNGQGRGEVNVTQVGDHQLLFTEKGSWKTAEGKEIVFSNVFRWTYDRLAGVISLEHLRFGVNHPVFLFHLAPSGPRSLASIDSHLCGGDTYFGKILCDRNGLRLSWRVIGPKKNEELSCLYT
jgi:hypothetical protein